MFSLISAVGKNHEIGKNKDLVFHVKDDMKFFRDTTSGHKVVMGRNTWESLPGKLKNRENIVITRSNPATLEKPLVKTSNLGSSQDPTSHSQDPTSRGQDPATTSQAPISPDQVISDLTAFAEENQNTEEEIFIIGGGTIYSAFLPYAKHLYLTEIDASVENADTFFPQFDKSKYRRTIIKKGNDHGLNYSIVKYTKL